MLMSAKGRLARLRYLPSGLQTITPGDHVLCAVTGEAIPLEHLRYWNVARQEAYSSAEIATRAMS